jgi:hypothetical protein
MHATRKTRKLADAIYEDRTHECKKDSAGADYKKGCKIKEKGKLE